MRILNDNGLTLIEILLSLTILGIVILPILNLFVMSAKINKESNREYKSLLIAQNCLEEIKSSDIDMDLYTLNNEGYYERTVTIDDEEYTVKIRVIPENSLIYTIEIFIYYKDNIINSLLGTKLSLN